jgi:hypothetical protein
VAGVSKTVPERLRDAAALFEKRNKSYGGNYRLMGRVMHEIYPNGLTIKTPEEWLRLMLQVHRVTKETRYAQNFGRGGHADSLEDMAVYAIMAAETDEMVELCDQSSGGYLPAQKPQTAAPVVTQPKIIPARPAPRVPDDPSCFPQSDTGHTTLPPDEFYATTLECERRIAEVCPPWSTRHDETGHGAWRYDSVTGPVAQVVKCAVTNTDVGSGVQLRLTFLREKPVEDSPEVATSDEWFQIKGHFKATD